jgi:hypothetical protein
MSLPDPDVPKNSGPDAGELAGFRARLRGGVFAALESSRPADFYVLDDEELRKWPGDTLSLPLRRIHTDAWNASEPQAVIELSAERILAPRSHLLATVLFAPDKIFDRLLESFGSSGQGLADTWFGMCWTAEAAWRAVTQDRPGGTRFSAGEATILRPLAARLRFLVLSEPMRGRADPSVTWWKRGTDEEFGGSGVLEQAFGPGSWDQLAADCQQARRDWQGYLDTYQSYPLLAQARSAQLERELRALVFRDVDARSPRQRVVPLGLSVKRLNEHAPLTAEDKAVVADVTERHLLPRFALAAVARLALYQGPADGMPYDGDTVGDDPRGRLERLARVPAAIAAGAAGLVAVGCAAALLLKAATIAAGVCYLLICAGVLLLPTEWGAMWLLRMPAASAVGIIALVTFLPGGWLGTPPKGGVAVAALAAVSLGYLVIEARNHGVGSAAAFVRALLVAAIGAVHALMVSLIGLVVVAPAFVQHGAGLDSLWSKPAYGHAGMVLALAAAWCLAVGVFSQILWDDRPITAPLAHLSWRTRLPRRRDGLDDADHAGDDSVVQRRRGPGRQRRLPAPPRGRRPGRLHPRRDALLVPRPGRHGGRS